LASKKTIKVGIVALGRAGWDIHVAALRSDKKYEIVAVCDSLNKRIVQAEAELGCVGYKEYSSFLEHPSLELVVIASPTKEHFWMTKEALRKGKNVVLEKPLAGTVGEINELNKIAKQTGQILCPFYNFRFKPDFLLIKSILAQGLIGKPFLFKRQVGYFNRRNDWQSKSDELGGILNAATIHAVDQVIQLSGSSPSEIWSDVRRIVAKGDAPDHSKIIINFSGGCVADVEVSWVEALPGCDWLIYGSRGAIRQYDKSLKVKWFTEDAVDKGVAVDRSYYSGEKIDWQEKTYKIKEGGTKDYYTILANALKGKEALPVTMESAIAAMVVLERSQGKN